MKRSIAASLLLGLAACSAGDAPSGTEAGVPPADADFQPADAGAGLFTDGGPTRSDGGADAAAPSARGEYETGEDALAADGRVTCFDGLDNDDDGIFDCNDLSCQSNILSCCVGANSTVCCAPASSSALPIASCLGDLGLCPDADALTVFGAVSSSVGVFGDDTEPSFVPGGASSDSGVLFAERLDPRRGAVTLRADVMMGLEPPPEGQLDVVGLGFVDASLETSDLTRVLPAAGVSVSGNRAEASLLVRGEVVGRWPIARGVLHTLELALGPEGTVSLTIDGATPATLEASLPHPLRGIAYGRTYNPTADSPAPVRVRSLVIEADACDIPSAVVRSGAPVVPAPLADTSWADGRALRSPSVAAWEDLGGESHVQMALMVDDEVFLAEPGAGGFELTTALDSPLLDRPTESWAAGGVDDPVLHWNGSEIELWFTGFDAAGTGSVARATIDDVSGRFANATRVGGLHGGESFEHAAPFLFGGALHAAVRVSDASGSRIVIYRLTDELPAGTVVRSPSTGDLFAFDRDEVASPAVLLVQGVVRVYFAGRRGTRWSIGEIDTVDLEYWHAAAAQPLFEGSGDGFDAVGVSDPAPFLDTRAAGGPALSLYYTGYGAVTPRIGLATRPLPPAPSP